MIDALFIAPGNAIEIYQGLSNKYSAVETPTWALLLAESSRSVGFDVNILDVAALSIIISESGGIFTDLNGKKPDLNIKSILAANPILHPEIKSHLDGRT